MSKLAIFFAPGFEEVEALTVVDICRRKKLNIDMVSVDNKPEETGSHGITVKMDKGIRDMNFDEYDCIVLPGGLPGTTNLEANECLMKQVDAFYAQGKYIAAICAAPSIFGHRGILQGRNACCYPSFESHLEGAEVSQNPVEVSGNVITSRGMGTAIEFGLTLLSVFGSQDLVDELAKGIVYRS